MLTNKNDIESDINIIFQDGIGIDILENRLHDEPFFGEKIGLEAIELVHILFAVEKRYSIRFTETEIVGDGFYSLSKLSDLVLTKLSA